MNASQIIQLLEQKHEKDVFVPECKDGPSQSGSHLRMDAWVMPRSWSKPAVTGYEVKVARQDFLRDEKWPRYLPYCNLFYFVCPTNLIQPEELPEGVGLMWASKTGTRIYTKRKAAHRAVEIPESLYRYILMSRTQITEPRYGGTPNEKGQDYWRQWLEEKKVDQAFGAMLRGAIAETVRKEVLAAREENARLQESVERLAGVKEFIRSLGLNPDNRFNASEYQVRRKLDELQAIVPSGLLSRAMRMTDEMKDVIGALEKLRNQDDKDKQISMGGV